MRGVEARAVLWHCVIPQRIDTRATQASIHRIANRIHCWTSQQWHTNERQQTRESASSNMLLLADIANYLFPAGMALLVVVLLRLTIRKRRKKNRRKPVSVVLHPVERTLTTHGLAPLHSREVELHEALREIRADVATRIGLLMQHTLSARAEADRLEAAIGHARELGQSPAGDTLAAIEAALEAAGGEDGAAQLDAALARLGAALVPAICAHDRTTIFRLAEEGHSAASIARQVDLPQGDVELLLQLGPAALLR